MNWIVVAIIGHLANGASFMIDKALLSTAFKRSATYAGLVGILSAAVIVAVPWVDAWPRGNVLLIGLLSGITFVFGLWAFFAALSRAEASRVVPIVGSLIPVLTLLGTFLFLDERLTSSRLAGFALLVIATAILSSSGGAARPSKATVALAVASAALFAVASVTGKFIYDAAGFLPGFLTTRLAAVATALVVVSLLDPLAGGELWSMVRPPKNASRKKNGKAALLAMIGQTIGAVGFLLVQLATAWGSAAIVNALQAVQYAFLVLIGFIPYKNVTRLLGEKINRRTIVVKVGALLITAVGLALIV